MIDPRYYQRDGFKSVIVFFESGGKYAILDIATGAGKSLILSMIIDYYTKFYGLRILVLTHRAEIVRQNISELRGLSGDQDIGINSAALKQRDTENDVIYSTVKSMRSMLSKYKPFDLIIVDECHLVPRGKNTEYQKVLSHFKAINSNTGIIGLTATPYRVDTGRMDRGDDRTFDKIIYTYSISAGVKDGFLAPLVSRAVKKQFDVSNVGKAKGEFIQKELIQAVNQPPLTRMAVDQIIEYSADRKAWMIFCVGKEHAYEVAREIKSRGISCETIISDTKNRDEIIDAFKDGKIRCLTCVDVLTTGFNAKNVDMIALLRPTLSTSLYVQMVGRGTRLCDGKKDCLVLDFGGNVRRHGPVDDINIATAGRSKEDEIKSHACPGCHSLVSIRKKVCPSCGFVIIPEAPKVVREASHSLRADVHVDIMGAPREIKWLAPTKITAKIHQKAGSPDSLKITYMVGFNLFDQYLPIAHPSAGHAARSWWAAVIGTNPPRSAQEALDRFLKEKRITAIVTERNGNFTNPCAWRVINQNGDVYEIDKTNKDYRKKKLFKAA